MHWSLDNWEQHAFLPSPQIGFGSVIESPAKMLEMWCAELDAMRRHLFNLCSHLFLSGRPSPLQVLRKLIEFAAGHNDVRFARCRDSAGLRRAGRSAAGIAPRCRG